MSIKYLQEYRDPKLSKKLINKIKEISLKKIRLMEVCGTHTMSIFKNGIQALLPENISLISGPGCPVCVTSQNEIDAFIELAKIDNVILASFGDLIKVPGTSSSLQKERSMGRDIRIVYSTFDCLEIAIKNPKKKVVFLAVGFETTAPTIAASVIAAKHKEINNYFIFSAHKLMPPVMEHLLKTKNFNIDGFILPGHVSVITGIKAFLPLIEKYHIPSVAAGFEPTDILQAILMLVKQIESGDISLENAYTRAVKYEGNKKAQKIMNNVFQVIDTSWRGIGNISKSGLKIRDKFESYDAKKIFDITLSDSNPPDKGCLCGQILRGLKTPPECKLYKKVCTPLNPVGPCMVSSEGTCSTYYRYNNS
ncbi:putative hydrogenase expression/formation protein MJ0993 [Candidatus Magnetomoraceae bacterium gMMP-15]